MAKLIEEKTQEAKALKHDIKISNIFMYVGLFSMVGVFFLLMYIFYMLFYPYEVFRLNNPIKVLDTEVKRGEPVAFLVDYCKEVEATIRMQVNFVNSALVPSVATYQHFPQGCHKIRVSAIVPLSTPPHEYSIILTKSYRVNAIRNETLIFESDNKFKVASESAIDSTASAEIREISKPFESEGGDN